MHLILNDILNGDSHKIRIYQEMITTWIQFSINEYSVYKNFDIATIAMASFFIGVSNINSEEISEEEQETNKSLFVDFLKKINIFSLEEVEKCARAIGEIYTKEDDEENEEQMKDEEFTGLLTRSNSTASLDAIFANCDKKGKATKKEERINLANVEFKLQLSGLDENKKEEFSIDNLKNDLLGKKRKFESS